MFYRLRWSAADTASRMNMCYCVSSCKPANSHNPHFALLRKKLSTRSRLDDDRISLGARCALHKSHTRSPFFIAIIHRESKKQDTYTPTDNCVKYQSIFKILSLLESAQNFLQEDHCKPHRTLQTSLHYPVNVEVIGKFLEKRCD